jgi:hypothetical protein
MVKFSISLKAGISVICFLGLFLSACDGTDVTLSSSSPACTPSPEANEYRKNMQFEIDLLYSRLFPDQINYDPNTLEGVKSDAFRLLRDQVKRWSSSNDIPVDNQVARITLTYISPDLAQTIILNNHLYQQILPKTEFQGRLKNVLDKIAEREEMIFLITIAYSQYNPNETEETMVVLNFPIKEMALINAGDKHINAKHFDPPLEHEIVISRGPLSGYIAFPIGIEEGGSCLHIMDPRWNTMLTINADGFKVNGNSYTHPLTWFVKRKPLVDMESSGVPSHPLSTPHPDNIYSVDHQPPLPVKNLPASQESDAYWEKMAIHLWGYVVAP